MACESEGEKEKDKNTSSCFQFQEGFQFYRKHSSAKYPNTVQYIASKALFYSPFYKVSTQYQSHTLNSYRSEKTLVKMCFVSWEKNPSGPKRKLCSGENFTAMIHAKKTFPWETEKKVFLSTKAVEGVLFKRRPLNRYSLDRKIVSKFSHEMFVSIQIIK